MTRVRVLYFASLREASGVVSEFVDSGASDLATLYTELRSRHRFALPNTSLRVAVNGEFAQWGDGVCEGSEVAFLPPVSGG